MAYDSIRLPVPTTHNRRPPRYRHLAALLLCGTIGIGACSNPEATAPEGRAPESTTQVGDAETPGEDDRPEKVLTADKAARRLTRMSSKLYESAYSTSWEQATQQFNRLQKLGDRIEASEDGAAENIDVVALQQQIETLSEAIIAEQQVPAMVAANQLMETGLQAAEAAGETAKFLPAARLGYQARQLELAVLGPDDADPQKQETIAQAAQQVIQTWETMSGGDTTTADAAPSGAAAKVDGAIAQLRQASVEEYPALARQIIDEAQKMMINPQR